MESPTSTSDGASHQGAERDGLEDAAGALPEVTVVKMEEESARKTYSLLDLPQETLDMIYHYLYPSYTLDAHICSFNRGTKVPAEVIQPTPPDYSIQLVCKKLRQDINFIRKRAFTGTLSITLSHHVASKATKGVYSSLPLWQRDRVTSLHLNNSFPYGGPGTGHWTSAVWDDFDFLHHMPNLQSIQLHVDITRFRYGHERYDSSGQRIETKAWRQLTPPKDGILDFYSRLDSLKVPRPIRNPIPLARYMNSCSGEGRLYIKVTIHWLLDDKSRVPLHQDVSDSVSVIEFPPHR